MSEPKELETMQDATSDAEAQSDGSEEESFKAMFEASLREQPVVRRGELIRGMIVSCNNETVTIDVGAKGEGVIPASEFVEAGLPTPKVGDEVDALVQSVGGSAGVTLSVLAARQREAWALVQAAVDNESTMEALITSEVKGGYRVSLAGLSAFMPRSEADMDPRIAADQLVGTTCQVAILEAQRKPENVVVSRKKPLSVVADAQRAAFLEKAAVGDKISGTVKRMTDFGAFIDIGGVDALLHVSDISWRRLGQPSEMLQIGQNVAVEITKLNAETGKVSVSMKALQADPWVNVAKTYEPGMRLTGTVRRLLDFGAVVELEPGIEAMIHRSELSWTKNDVKPAQVLSEGDVVDVAVLEVDAEARRIRLSLKSVTENPWQTWLSDNPVGSKVTGKIKNITEFGFFVPVADGLDGLVHLENMSWEKSGADALKEFTKGQTVEAVVLGVDVDKQRISLGIKQLLEDPFEVFLAGVKRGQGVNGTIVEVKPAGAVVELADGVQAFLPMREVPREHEELKAGNKIEAKITEVNRKRRQVELSIRQHLRDEERDAMRNYAKQSTADGAPSALALELKRKWLELQAVVDKGEKSAPAKKSGGKTSAKEVAAKKPATKKTEKKDTAADKTGKSAK